MSIYDFFKGKIELDGAKNVATMKEIEKQSKPRKRPTISTKGRNGVSQVGGRLTDDFLPQLRDQRGVRVYQEMSLNDPVVGSILNQFELRLRTTKWNINAKDNSGDSAKLKLILEKSMSNLNIPWSYVMSNMASVLTFGWSIFEDTYEVDPVGHIILKKLGFRAQDTYESWKFNDKNEATHFIQRLKMSGQTFTIPLSRTFHLTTTPHTENPMGKSILRSAYRPWLFKKTIEEIEGIGIERDIAGIPHIHFEDEAFDASISANSDIIDYAEDLVTSIAKDNQQGVVTYPGMSLKVLQGRATTMGTDKIIGRYNQGIAMALAAQYMIVAFEARGSGTVAETYSDLMFDSIDSWNMLIIDMFMLQVVENLKVFNGLTNAQIEIIPSTLAERDKVDFAAFLARTVKGGLITPDDVLEKFIRNTHGLPEMDKETSRAVAGVIEPEIAELEEQPEDKPTKEKIEKELEKSEREPYFEIRDQSAVECDFEGATEEESDYYAVECGGVIMNTQKYKSVEKAIESASKYEKFGVVTLAKSAGKRNHKHVYRKLMRLF